VTSVSAILGESHADHPLKWSFLKWQCLTRQIMMRDNQGRPGDAITPAVILSGQKDPLGHIITILNKTPNFSLTPEMRYMAQKTLDPAIRREQALQFFSSTYYQKHREFSDILTSTFPPASQGAAEIRDAEHCSLLFDAYNQKYTLACKVWRLAAHNALNEATLAHNRLFNPGLPSDTEVLAFEPDWSNSVAETH